MTTKIAEAGLAEYLRESRTWETNKVRQAAKSERTAWIIAATSAIIAVVAVIAIAGLTPLKTVEPYVIRVDNSTGIVDVVEALTDGKTNYEESVNKYFTQWYVKYREGYSKDLAEDYYYNVGIMSGSLEQQKYYQLFNPKNPQSPLNIYGPYAKVKVKIKSTSFIKPTVAMVRYTKEIERGLDNPQVTHWAATITFKYTRAPMAEKDRAINPLGFQVLEYRNDPDAQVGDASAPSRSAVDVLPRLQTQSQNSISVFPSAPLTTDAPGVVVPPLK